MTIQEIQNARQAKPLRELPDEQREAAIEAIVKRLYAQKGYLINEHSEEEIGILTTELTDKLNRRYSYLRLSEVMLALEAGIYGEYTKSTGLTVANCMMWISCYVSSDAYKEAVSYVPKPKMDPASLLPRHDVAELNESAMVDSLCKYWAEFKVSRRLNIILDGYAAAMADYLISKGKLKPTRETLEKVVRKTAPKGSDIETIIAAGLTNASWAAKRELLYRYFSGLADRGVELSV